MAQAISIKNSSQFEYLSKQVHVINLNNDYIVNFQFFSNMFLGHHCSCVMIFLHDEEVSDVRYRPDISMHCAINAIKYTVRHQKLFHETMFDFQLRCIFEKF